MLNKVTLTEEFVHFDEFFILCVGFLDDCRHDASEGCSIDEPEMACLFCQD